MKKTLRALAMIIACTMLFGLISACGGGETSNESPQPTTSNPVQGIPEDEVKDTVSGISDDATLNVVVAEEPTHLVSGYKQVKTSGVLMSTCIFDTLFEYDDETGEYTAGACTEYEWVDDTHLRITIRDDMYAADGTNYKASDLLYTASICVNGESMSYWSMIDINECSVESDYVFILGLKEPYPTVVDILGTSHMFILLDESSVEAAGGFEYNAQFCNYGVGRYLVDEWVEGQYVRLVRRDDHWDKDNEAYYKYIQFTFVSDASARVMALQSGDADLTIDLNYSQSLAVSNDSNLSLYVRPTNGVKTLTFNCSDPILSDVRVRQAFWYAIDDDALSIADSGGYGEAADISITPQSIYYCEDADGPSRERDLEKAKELLTAAGYPNGVEIDLICLSNASTLAEIIKANCAEAGITVNIEVMESTRTVQQQGDYSMYIDTQFTDDCARMLMRVDGRVSTEDIGGGSIYVDEEYYALLDAAYGELDYDARVAAYNECLNYMRDNVLNIGLYCTCTFTATRGEVAMGRVNQSGFPFLWDVKPVAG